MADMRRDTIHLALRTQFEHAFSGWMTTRDIEFVTDLPGSCLSVLRSLERDGLVDSEKFHGRLWWRWAADPTPRGEATDA